MRLPSSPAPPPSDETSIPPVSVAGDKLSNAVWMSSAATAAMTFGTEPAGASAVWIVPFTIPLLSGVSVKTAPESTNPLSYSYVFLFSPPQTTLPVLHYEISLSPKSINVHLDGIFEGKKGEVFTIELEKPVTLSLSQFGKSGTSKAKIDVWISFEDLETKVKHSCAIELKFFKFVNHREPKNRYDVFSDIQNLEAYGEFADLCFLIVATDHHHYINQDSYSPDTADFDFRNGRHYEAETLLTYRTVTPHGPPIWLKNSYDFVWHECADGIHFLKLSVDTHPI